ncbi:MAG TPA: DUF2085 domain-containing protein [Candidatus Acidoferrum sp.]|nr:DUF2085 domain-containing protein [Candidatus Acidoferrum sp.]
MNDLSPADRRWIAAMEWGGRLGCHQLPGRSLFYRGYQFPLCARCTGVVAGTLLALPVFFFWRAPPALCLALCAVMLLDWLIQRADLLPSTNPRRLVTGLMGGFGCTTLELWAIAWLFM